MPNAKHSAQRAADGIHAQQRWEVADDAERLALNGVNAVPPLVRGGVCLQADGTIWDLIQVEPSIVWQRRPTNAELSQIAYSSDHGSLGGLGDDDHPQYLLTSGARQLIGNLAVAPAVTIDGRDISADGATLDALGTTVAGHTTAIAGKADSSALTSHTGNTSNPHAVTAAQVGAVPAARTVSTTAPLTGGGALSGNLTLAISAATTGAAGSMSAADKTKLDALPDNATLTTSLAGKVNTTRTVTAGTGLTGGGALSGDITLNVGAHADGSIVVAADSVQVGVLASDAQHGNRGGGSVHANVVAGGAAGFMTGTDKTKLDALPDNATLTASLAAKSNRRLALRTVSGTSDNLAQGDEDTGVETTNAAAVTLTAPQLAVGTQITVRQSGAGQITVAAGSGVTLRAPLGAKSLMQYTWLLLFWKSATEVDVSGHTAL